MVKPVDLNTICNSGSTSCENGQLPSGYAVYEVKAVNLDTRSPLSMEADLLITGAFLLALWFKKRALPEDDDEVQGHWSSYAVNLLLIGVLALTLYSAFFL